MRFVGFAARVAGCAKRFVVLGILCGGLRLVQGRPVFYWLVGLIIVVKLIQIDGMGKVLKMANGT